MIIVISHTVKLMRNGICHMCIKISFKRTCAYANPERGTGGPDPPEKSQNYWFPSNTGLLVRIPCKITRLPSQHLNGVSLAGQ